MRRGEGVSGWRPVSLRVCVVMGLERPSSLGNDNTAAVLIQAAFRRHQKREEERMRTNTMMLETLEEASEAMINKRSGLLRVINSKLSGGLTQKLSRGMARLRLASALGRTKKKGDDNAPANAEAEEDVEKAELESDNDSPTELPSLSPSALEDIMTSLKDGSTFSMIDALAILGAAMVVFAGEDSVNFVDATENGSVVVVGDLHGQLHDLMFIFDQKGMPSEDNKYIFNGDLVDRGNHGCEIAILLCALKVAYPKFVFINRGNHEEAFINIYSGFEEECLGKYDHKVFQMFHRVFDWLPYACVVNSGVFVIHGGPPCDEGATIEDLRTLPRGQEGSRQEVDEKRTRWYKDIIWSDPHPEGSFLGSTPSHRGAGMLWGKDVSHRFLEMNDLSIILRSHQCVPGGIETCHGGKCFTLFSASRYCGTGENKGAVLVFKHGETTPQPANALVWSVPMSANLLGYERIRSERKGKEAVNDAVAAQAREYIIEYKTELYAHWQELEAQPNRPAKRGLINLYEWATGLTAVLKIKILWSRVFDKLVKEEDIVVVRGKRHVAWKTFLADYTVQLKGGCKAWQDDVVSRITSAVLQSGGDLLAAFEEMDADKSGEISKSEFLSAVRNSLPALSVLSDAQLAAVWDAFDADNSGSVDFDEFKNMLTSSMTANSTGEHQVGVRWSTQAKEGETSTEMSWEKNLSESLGRLFYSHRQELHHIWHTKFELDESKSLSKEDFIQMLRVLDESTGKHLLSEEGLVALADGMDTDGNGRIDFKEFCVSMGRIAGTY